MIIDCWVLDSYVYKYVLTPMNVALIEYFPMWMAPNGTRSLYFVGQCCSVLCNAVS